MKQLLKKSAFSLMLLLSSIPAALGQCCPTGVNGTNDFNGVCASNLGSNTPVHTHILYRSQGANTARELIGWQTEIYRPDMCDYYGVATFAFEYQRTFREERIAYDWFGASCLSFQGSAVTNRSENALLADYFGLGSTYDGSICFCPRIQNYIFDWNFFVGLDCWMQGLYFRAHLPLVHSKWSLRNGNNNDNSCCAVACCPSPVSTGTLPQCFINDELTTPAVSNIEAALACNAASTGSGIFGINRAGCFNFCEMDDTKLADIDLILGWLFYNDDCYHLGVFLQYVAPTGTNYGLDGDSRYAGAYFRPQIGNGHHHEFGAGITGHAMLWDDQQYQSLAFYFEGNVTHMFGDTQCRLFDLCNNGAYSRYMLLREFNADGTPTGNLVRANNTSFANRLVDVKVDAKVDFSFKFAYRYCNWAFDLGYNVYYHSQEELSCDNRHNNFNNGCNTACVTPTGGLRYGVAGLTGFCCFPATVVAGDAAGTCDVTLAGTTSDAPLTSLAPNATMFSTANGALGAAVTPPADPACLAYSTVANPALGLIPGTTVTVPCSSLFAATTETPVTANLLSADSINLRSGLSPEYLSHKIFGHINYMWCDECGWNPFLGIGFEVEFDGNNRHNDRDCFNNNSVCGVGVNGLGVNNVCRDNNQRVGLNQWGVWIKGGINF